MQVIFCTTCKGRAHHIEQTLPQNLKDNRKAKFVLLDYFSQDGLDAYILNHHQGDMDSGKLIYYKFTTPCKFNMTHAKNMAHRLALNEGADIVVNLDADNFTGVDFDQWLIKSINDDFYAYGQMKKGVLDRGISGRIATTKHQFYVSGGYDEVFKTWSPDDKDYKERLERLDFKGLVIPDEYLKAIRHSDRLRFKDYPQISGSEADEELILKSRPDVTVSNYGRIGLGVVYNRNFKRGPIIIEPIATKIFGIGWHKTATTSLSAAIRELGFKCDHWRNPTWAKAIWTELTQFDRRPIFERCYGVADVPICLLYERLDTLYPGSKFILTVRNEDEWLQSVEGHFNRKINPYRKFWDKDPFSNQIHTEMYGRTTFDSDIFLARYRKHNSDVLDYFKGDKRFLVMDMSRNAGWLELCNFLRQPIPLGDYPRLNRK